MNIVINLHNWNEYGVLIDQIIRFLLHGMIYSSWNGPHLQQIEINMVD